MDLDVEKPVQLAVFGIMIVGGLMLSLSDITSQKQVDPVDTDVPEPEKEEPENFTEINETNESLGSKSDQLNVSEIIQNKSKEYRKARPLVDPEGYINTENVSIEESIGEKIILLDMWTYSCINCQRTLPHIQEWHEKYEDDGLLVIGNHAPEFEFEKKRSNVEDAVERFNITYPVVLDNEWDTWDAYNNRYWPQKYLIGVDGFVRYEHIGEGSYNETEQKIRELLKEKNQRLGIDRPIDEDGVRESESQKVNFSKIETSEIYFGAERNSDYLANGEAGEIGVMEFDAPDVLSENKLYLDGEWNIIDKYAEGSPGDSILLDYKAKNVNMVLDGNDTKVKVYQNGDLIEESAGDSVKDSTLTINSEKLYRIIENQDYQRNKLRLEVESGTLRAYTFTFG